MGTRALVLHPLEWAYTRSIYTREFPMLNFSADEEAASLAPRYCGDVNAIFRLPWDEVTIVMPAVKERPVVRGLLIAVEGFTLALLRSWGLKPDVVVTDFDFHPWELINYGGLVLGHAHGDNIPSFETWAPRVNRLIPTVQVWPRGCSVLVPGFTDGDRAVYLAYCMGARLIRIYGFDPSRPVKRMDDVKSRKLALAKHLIDRVGRWVTVEFL